ncbi:hypothetical protein RFI_34558 [Reticulomyxa filosa]|uniref:Uncharacterized protein n=1 Tax=Reticulomyxa filosa TaxID=46433 RepID=X6LQ46_RETFI|nr:hypothetical protein RFI_34558 [Reticulomyxa filosa]|eukprot:ETO02855.1 hypothetical protein RFI_34558 [Reticulomyxa filosa]
MYLPEGECTSFAQIMLNYVSKHYSTNIQQAHVLKSSILPFHAFVKELGAILLSKQLELQQLPTSVSSIILFIKARDVIGLIELPNPNDKPSQSLYPIEQLQKWNKLKMIQIKMLQKLKWEFFAVFEQRKYTQQIINQDIVMSIRNDYMEDFFFHFFLLFIFAVVRTKKKFFSFFK